MRIFFSFIISCILLMQIANGFSYEESAKAIDDAKKTLSNTTYGTESYYKAVSTIKAETTNMKNNASSDFRAQEYYRINRYDINAINSNDAPFLQDNIRRLNSNIVIPYDDKNNTTTTTVPQGCKYPNLGGLASNPAASSQAMGAYQNCLRANGLIPASSSRSSNKNYNTHADDEEKFDWTAYYNSDEYKELLKEIEIEHQENEKFNKKFCYNYPEKHTYLSEATNCLNNHICINYCEENPTLIFDEEKADKECILNKTSFSEEENEAFLFLCRTNIINDTDINKANLHKQLTRAEMAQLISSYALKFLQKMRSYKANCGFGDVYWGTGGGALDTDLYAGVYDACQLNLMGVGTFNFNPNGIVKRADFGTVLSRMLRQDKYNNTGKNWYDGHLNALKSAGIMNNIDPEITEQKARVLLMLYRNSQSLLGKSINDRERKPSDYYEPGMTEEEKDAFDEYYAGQNAGWGVVI